MFEKEAEEYMSNLDECRTKNLMKDAFKDGAEFGYNKAFVEADKNLKAIVTDFNKANEWHEIASKRTPEGEISKKYMPKNKEENCELLGIIQGKDKVIQELEKENAELKNRNSELAGKKASLERWYGEAKELVDELSSSLSVVGECEEEECELLNRAEQFLRKSE